MVGSGQQGRRAKQSQLRGLWADNADFGGKTKPNKANFETGDWYVPPGGLYLSPLSNMSNKANLGAAGGLFGLEMFVSIDARGRTS